MHMVRYLVDQALEIALLFDGKGMIQYGNKRATELLNYDFSDRRVCMTEIFPTVCTLENDRLVFNLPDKEQLCQIMAYRANRTCFAVEAQFLPYEAQTGMYVCFALDASQLTYYEKKANQAGQEVEAAQQVKTQFVANVTHELRTPVNGILGNTKELMSIEDAPDKRKLLDLIERGCNDMHAIINNILDFSKLDAGKFTLEKAPFHFANMMDYIRMNHINKISEKGLQFFMTISPDIPEYVIGDELRIKQILNNLISNAVKFTSIGRIAVEVIKTAQIENRIELFFMVIDSGIGISKEGQDKLFKSFSQVEASTTRKYGGTGLGLYISKQLVELMDGGIHVESAPNRGTMFSFHVWVDVPPEELDKQGGMQAAYEGKVPSFADVEDHTGTMIFGSKENLIEIQKKMSKLILCVEMDNWEKAEMFMDMIRQLTESAPKEIKSAALRLKMSVQKEDYDKTVAAFDTLKVQIEQLA